MTRGDGWQHPGHTDSPAHRRDRGRLLALVGSLAALVVAGCSRSSPLRSIHFPTPVPPTPTAASVGMLRNLFPLLGGLADSQAVTIERRWSGYHPVSERSEVYPLERRGLTFTGDGAVSIRGPLGKRADTRTVSVPLDAMQAFLWRVAEASVAERPYVPSRPTTDDYPEIDIQVVLAGSPPVRAWTESQGPGNVPWGVEHAGRNFVVHGPVISNALQEIERYLLADLVRQLVRETEEEYRSPLPKP